MHPIEVGIGIIPLESWEDTLAIALEAERLGFASIAMWDHPNLPGLEVQTALAALAATTSRIRLWANVLAVPFRPPSIMARAMASIDVVSRGRLILGLGTGWKRDEFDAYGLRFEPKPVRDQQLAEAIGVTRALWTSEPATFEGTTWSIRGAHCRPKPAQRPSPPIWVGSHGGERLLRDVVVPIADGCNLGMPSVLGAPPIDAIVRRVHDACDAHGRDPASLALSTNLVVEGSPDAPEVSLAGEAHIEQSKFLRLSEPDHIVDRIEHLRSIGIDHVMLGLKSPSPVADLPRLAHALADQLAPR